MYFKPIIIKVSSDSSPEQRLKLESAAHQLMTNISIVDSIVHSNSDLTERNIMLCYPQVYHEMRRQLNDCLMQLVMGPSTPFIEKLTKFIQMLNDLDDGEGTSYS